MPARPRGVIALLACAALLTCTMPVFAGTLRVVVTGVDGDLASAVKGSVRASQYAGRTDVTETQARMLAQDAGEQATRALRPLGYYNATARTHLEQSGDAWTLHIDMAAGPPTKVASLDIRIPEPALELKPVARAVRGFKPRVGDQMNDPAYEASKTVIDNAFLETGWLDAKPTTHRVEVTRAENRADIHLHYATGERYKLGEVTFEGSQFYPGFLQRYVPWQPGDWYSLSNLMALQQALSDADYFSIIEVDPQVEAALDQVVPVKVELTPAKRTVYTAGLFMGTDTGPGIRLGARRRWVNRRGHTANTQLVIAQHLKTAQIVYGIPLPGRDHHHYNIGVNYRDEDTTTSVSRTYAIAANDVRNWHGFTRTIGVNLLGGTFTVGNNGGDVNIPGVEHGESTLVYGQFGLSRKVADNPLFVRRGYSLDLVANAGPGIDTRFAQVVADATWIRAFTRRDRVVIRGIAGITFVQDFDDLPPQLRFYTGGDRTIRGYAFQAIGPRNSYGLVVGGTRLLVLSTTVEHYFTRNWGMAAFVDTGDAFDGADFHAQTGAGLGLRWRSPIGMLRVDVGVPVDNDYYHGARLHIILGTDL